MKNQRGDELMLVGQVAAKIRRGPDMVRYLERTGRLRAIRVGRLRLFTRDEVERFLNERKAADVK